MNRIKGFEAALEALRGLDAKSQERILSDIFKKDPELAERLKKSIVVFDDLIKVNPKGIASLLQAVNEAKLVVALRGKPPEFVAALLKPLSQRKADLIREAMAQLGPQPMSKVEEAQKEVLEKALALEKLGQLIFTRGDDPLV